MIRATCTLFLAVLAAASAAGCVVIPLPPHTVEGVNAGAKVGRAGSWTRPLKVGTATRHDVIERLGEPARSNNGGKQLAYRWRIRTGFALGLVLSGYPPFDLIDRERIMWLNFDSSGLLTAYTVVDDDTIGPGYGFQLYDTGVSLIGDNPFAPRQKPFRPSPPPTTQPHARPPLPVP